MRSAETELQNTLELPATVSEITAPKPDLDAKTKKKDFEAFCKRNFKRKLTSSKIKKILTNQSCSLVQYDLRFSAEKAQSITHAAAARSNLDAAIPMRSATRASRNA